MKLDSMEKIRAAAAQGGARRLAVAAAHDEAVLRAVADARRQALAEPILVGDAAEIERLLRALGEDPAAYEILNAQGGEACAQEAVRCVSQGRAELLMKGGLATASLLRAVLRPEAGLRTGRLLSHVMLYEAPGHRLLALTDGGVNPFPQLAQKAEILENAALVLRALGYETMQAACVCGAETVNPKIASTVDAQALTQMHARWAPLGLHVYGPVGLDLAVSREACRCKRYDVPGVGEADILLVPAYETGNGIGKAMSVFAGAKNAGVVTGARVPVVLVSRSDSAQTKLSAIALGACLARAEAHTQGGTGHVC